MIRTLVIDLNFKKNSLGFYEFVLPLLSIAKNFGKCKVKHYSEISPDELKKDYEIILLSGNPLKDKKFLEDIEKFIWMKKENEKTILGICAGMQLISLIFGSNLKKCMEIGMTEIKTLKENSFLPYPKFIAYELHNYAVEPSEEFEIIAKSDKCIQCIKHKEKEIYGFLFYPEVRNKSILEKFFKNFKH